MKRILFIITVLFTSLAAMAGSKTLGGSQLVQQADKAYAKYQSLYASSKKKAQSFSYLKEAYRLDSIAINSYGKELDSNTYQHCKNTLLKIFDNLSDAVYYYTEQDNRMKSAEYAKAYVDLSLFYALSDQHLQDREDYSQLVYFAAVQAFNSDEYGNAERYLRTYLSTPDTRYREQAFEGLTNALCKLRKFDEAKYFASVAIESFPSNKNILKAAIVSCQETKDYQQMQKYLTLGMNVDSYNEDYCYNQALLYEQQGEYSKAAELLARIYNRHTDEINYVQHLAQDYYNAGVKQYNAYTANSKNKKKSQMLRLAKQQFTKAIPYLSMLFENDPYAYNYAHNIAICYSLTNQNSELASVNKKLIAMGGQAVNTSSKPAIDYNYEASHNVTEPKTTPVTAPITTPEPYKQPKNEFVSDIDMEVPVLRRNNNNTYAIIIGNEDYKYKVKVDYAKNDAQSFYNYCEKMFSIPKDHIRMVKDATLSEIKEQVRYMQEKAKMNPGELSFLFYYAGHGIPDFSNGESYLLPTDATGTDYQSCYKLDDLYAQFNEMDVKKVTVFLDACFSGATGKGEMLANGRFVEYEPIAPKIPGKTIVFSAASGKQAALPYDDQHHGYFTYYLLKNLKATNGNITLEKLAKQLTKDVDNKAFDQKNRHQTPQVKTADNMSFDWKNSKVVE